MPLQAGRRRCQGRRSMSRSYTLDSFVWRRIFASGRNRLMLLMCCTRLKFSMVFQALISAYFPTFLTTCRHTPVYYSAAFPALQGRLSTPSTLLRPLHSQKGCRQPLLQCFLAIFFLLFCLQIVVNLFFHSSRDASLVCCGKQGKGSAACSEA